MSTFRGHARTLRQLLTGLVLAIGALTVADVALGESGPMVSQRVRFAGVAALLGLGVLVAAEHRGDSGDERAIAGADGDGPSVGDHYRATNGASHPGAVYRVVGSDGEVTLLRLTDVDGRRRHTGELVTPAREDLETGFEPASDPDAGFAPGRGVRNQLQGLYWSVRRFF